MVVHISRLFQSEMGGVEAGKQGLEYGECGGIAGKWMCRGRIPEDDRPKIGKLT